MLGERLPTLSLSFPRHVARYSPPLLRTVTRQYSTSDILIRIPRHIHHTNRQKLPKCGQVTMGLALAPMALPPPPSSFISVHYLGHPIALSKSLDSLKVMVRR
jgi:hypothetical protein